MSLKSSHFFLLLSTIKMGRSFKE